MEPFPAILLDCSKPGRPVGLATGDSAAIDWLCKSMNKLNGAKPPRNKRIPWHPPFMWTAQLSERDCRQDLVAAQAMQLAEAAANQHHFAEPLATCAPKRESQLALL